MKRTPNGPDIPVCYVHVDIGTAPGSKIYSDGAERNRLEEASRVSSATLSVNVNVLATEAIVKLAVTEQEARALIAPAAVIRIYTEAEIEAVRGIVNALGWYPEVNDNV